MGDKWNMTCESIFECDNVNSVFNENGVKLIPSSAESHVRSKHMLKALQELSNSDFGGNKCLSGS